MLARRDGRVGRLTLNRPRALNALTRDMVLLLTEALAGWRGDPGIHAVVIEGSGRAFCAGGDVRMVREHVLKRDHAEVERFFAEEYALNLAIARYPKPFIALIGGVCMGGGIGVSVHGSARVVTPEAMFAMPETAIALFPDVGTTYVLPRLRGALGMWLALTGARLNGADAVYAGLATHLVDSTRLETLADEIAAEGPAVLGGLIRPDGAIPGLRELRPAIDRCFGAASLGGVLTALGAEGTEWAAETVRELHRHSPSSVLWSFEIVQAGASRTLAECLDAELALTRRATRHPDFAEGVRAMVVDKDRSPRWSPATLEELDTAEISP